MLLPCLYLPTLATNFDFIDDGNLVYPAPPMPLAERLDLVWLKIVNNFKHLGPFRPVLWLHWEAQAELLGGSPVCWRIWRLAWTMFAAGALLALLRDLRFRPGPSLVVTALAMWNPFRGEVWTSLTLAEGLAMPYALLALLCAVRANRSSRPWIWDLAGMLAVLAALGCKNTFAALVPAQVLLRLAPDGQSLREGWRQHGRRALLLLLPLLLPVIHFIIFTLSWRPGQYTMNLTCLGQARRMVAAIGGAISIDMMGAGLLLAVLAVAVNGGLAAAWKRHRGPCRAGLALLVCGIGIYLPLGGIAGRYTMPAVWGLDLLLAVLLTELAAVTRPGWRRLAQAALACGLIAVAISNLGRQQLCRSHRSSLEDPGIRRTSGTPRLLYRLAGWSASKPGGRHSLLLAPDCPLPSGYPGASL